jgi:CMP-N-acetylneuraminic acid synthetase
MVQIVGLITARGGSKGLPGKNVRPLLGKPLIAWTIDAAKASASLSRVIVSTDDLDIAAAARRHGAEVPFIRPPELAQDNSSHISVVEHALGWLGEKEGFRPDYLLLLQPTSPLRTAEDIEGAIEVAVAGKARAVIGVCEPAHHPAGLKRITPEGAIVDMYPQPAGYVRRQDLPTVYAVNGAIYLARTELILEEKTFEPPDARPYVMPRERSLDIDTLWDFQLAEMILELRRRQTA